MRILLLALLLFVPLCAQQPPPPGPGGNRPRPEPKNLKILKVPGSEVGPIMRNISAALGVQCNHCHVPPDFASDENPKKEIARHMMTMTQEINAKFPDGKRHVGCYTCHRGEKEPQVMAPAPAAAPKPPAE